MNDILKFYATHHAEVHEVLALVLAVVNVLITAALRLQPLTSWVAVAEKSPRIAAFVRLLGAFGIQPTQILQSLIDLIRGTASPGTRASAKTLQVSSSAPLIAPASAGTPPKVSP